MSGRPLVSIVTPSFNAAGFIERTIRSVLSQDYPYIEYRVMDGGSTDGTLDILRTYGDRLQFVSERDSGAPQAINRGFRLCRGTIIGWLSADDTYLPGAISQAVHQLFRHPAAGAVYGNAFWTDQDDQIIGPYPTEPFCRERLARECFICQPACFMRTEALLRSGGLDETLQLAFDYDLWIRVSEKSAFQHVPEYWATSRMHRTNKTLGQRRQVYREGMQVLSRHFGYVPVSWVFDYCSHVLNGRDQFFEKTKPSGLAYIASLPVGWYFNPSKPIHYSREWAAILTARWNRHR